MNLRTYAQILCLLGNNMKAFLIFTNRVTKVISFFVSIIAGYSPDTPIYRLKLPFQILDILGAVNL